MTDSLALYNQYHIERDDERLSLFRVLGEAYDVKRVLYPGCFVHITPSFVFRDVVYVDSDVRAERFFGSPRVLEFIERSKRYAEPAEATFYRGDYAKGFGERDGLFDLLVSQYAGFISQACKRYLRIGGILVANDSHGDASMASLDGDYELVAVYNKRNGRYVISERRLDEYFVPRSGVQPVKGSIEKARRGVGYSKSASGYVFRRVA